MGAAVAVMLVQGAADYDRGYEDGKRGDYIGPSPFTLGSNYDEGYADATNGVSRYDELPAYDWTASRSPGSGWTAFCCAAVAGILAGVFGAGLLALLCIALGALAVGLTLRSL